LGIGFNAKENLENRLKLLKSLIISRQAAKTNFQRNGKTYSTNFQCVGV
jgi:hypothetical protein